MGLLGCTQAIRRRPRLFQLFSLLIIAAGVFFVVYGSINYEKKEETSEPDKESHLGIVIDAGGSGTRLYVYEYQGNRKFKQLLYKKCEDEGLGNWPEEQFPELKNELEKCFSQTSKALPNKSNVPLYLGATAGMRLLKHRNETVYNEVWQLVNNSLADSDFEIKVSKTLTGFEEAIFAWVAANYLKKTIDEKEKYGVIDFGSSSIQLVFSPKNQQKTEGKPELQTFMLDGEKMTVYGNSYLCFGKVEMERRLLAKLVSEAIAKSGGNITSVGNPCFFTNAEKNFTSGYIFKPPCSSGEYAKNVMGASYTGPQRKQFTIYGTGNGTECFEQLKQTINFKCSKGENMCGMNDVFQPRVDTKILALTIFQYATSFMGLPSNATRTELEQGYQTFCKKPWHEISTLKIPDTPPKYRFGRCFDSAYSYFLLTEGFKFNGTNWNISFQNQINGSKLNWALGWIYTQKDKLYDNSTYIALTILKRSSSLLALAIIGAVLILLGLMLLFISCRKRSK